MHLCERNKEYLWYANQTGEAYVTDENGYKTGEKMLTYSTPVREKFSMAISSGANNLGSQGMAELERYGITTGYTHRAVTENMDCQMDEGSLVWYKRSPVDSVYNFRVVRKATSLNHLIYYLKEVDVSG